MEEFRSTKPKMIGSNPSWGATFKGKNMKHKGLFGDVRPEVLKTVRDKKYLSNIKRIDENIQLLMKEFYEQKRDTK